MHRTRRRFLGSSAAAISVAAAGCLASSRSGADAKERHVQASFYLLYDLARNAAGDDVEVESVVPFGQHGHGWDGPTAGQQRDIVTSDLFVYMGDGFQPWADDVVENVHDEGADVEIVAARAGVELLEFDEDHDEDARESEDHGDEEADDHDHGAHDPHFWLDPTRTEQAVENVRDGLIAVDPDDESTYRERAEAYVEELDALHAKFDAALSNAEKDAVLVAGHNAFRYLGDAYGFEVFGLTGISPDEGPSASARRDAESVIDEHGIEYVLHPVLEPRAPAEQIVADTSAKDVLDVTAISGVTDEWVDADVGYLELMQTINLPSFTRALGGR